MRTPAGTECPYYYADYYRGREKQECRLVSRSPDSDRWEPSLCARCPVPRIVQTNACPHLVLEGRVVRRWGGLDRRVRISATCTRSLKPVPKPEVGCGQCHASLPFTGPP